MNRLFLIYLFLLMCSSVACTEATEAPRVSVPIVVDADGIVPVTTNLGYEIQLTSVQIALRDVVFTIAGEVHEANGELRIPAWLVPTAYAHPGHYQGGEITGELSGRFVIDWPVESNRQLGTAQLIAGTYKAANFVLDRGAETDGLTPDHPMIGHTAVITGDATKDGKTIQFQFVVDSPEGREIVGAPFEATIVQSAPGTVGLRFNPRDELENDTIFDNIDFGGLDTDGDGQLSVTPDVPTVEETYNTFRKEFQSHDHFSVSYKE